MSNELCICCKEVEAEHDSLCFRCRIRLLDKKGMVAVDAQLRREELAEKVFVADTKLSLGANGTLESSAGGAYETADAFIAETERQREA